MKILAIGDFHGKFPQNLKREAKNVDLIVSIGDYADAEKIRKIIFKHWTNKPWYEVVGMKKANELEKKSFNSGLKILKDLNSLGKPVYILWGNADFYKDYRFSSSSPVIMPGYYDNKIKKMKNLVLLDKRKKIFKKIDLIGHGGYVDPAEYIKHPIDEDKNKYKKRIVRYKEDERRLKGLFSKGKLRKNFIFAMHYAPEGYFDKIDNKKNPMHGKHVGWLPYYNMIKKYKPSLALCGHMHEYQGVKNIGKTELVAVGPAYLGKAAIIDIDDKTQKINKINFIN